MLDKEGKQERSKQHSKSNVIKRVEERNNSNEKEGEYLLPWKKCIFVEEGVCNNVREKIKFEKRSFKSYKIKIERGMYLEKKY